MTSLMKPTTPRKGAGLSIRNRILRVVIVTPQGQRYELRIRPREGDWRDKFGRFLAGLCAEGNKVEIKEVS